MSAQQHAIPLPQEIRELALTRAVLVAPKAPEWSAPSLTDIAGRNASACWQPLRQLVPTRHAWLRNAWLHYDAANGAPPLAVGSIARLDASTPAYYVAIDGEVLQHAGRPLLFSTAARAQRAASLAAMTLCAQELARRFAEMVRRADTLTSKDLAPFDAAMRRYRGAVRVAQEDWSGKAIEIVIPERLPPTGRWLVGKLLSIELPATRAVH